MLKKETVVQNRNRSKKMKKSTHKARVRQTRHTGKPFVCLTHAFLPTLIVFVLMCSETFGQIPVIKTPKPTTFKTIEIGTTNPTPNSRMINGMTEIQRNNQGLIRNIELTQRQSSYQKVQELYSDFDNNSISYKLPDLTSLKGTDYFRNALSEINEMLIGKVPLDLKRAAFIVENAYFENQLDFAQFEKSIQNAIDICNLKMSEYELNKRTDLAINFTIFDYITDTLSVNLPSQEKELIHYPIKYDFNDYMGAENWSNMFVSKLMATNSGQCHSMPLFYLILAQELGAESYLTFSPNHSFVRFKSENGDWYNAELTCGAIISDAAILESGYVKAEAIKSGIYMDTLSQHETVACLLNTLANSYVHKYGYDSFVKQCADTVLKYYPNQLNAIMIESNWQTKTTMYIARQKGKPSPDIFNQDLKAKTEFERMHEIYSQIDALGYEIMPEEHYLKWLKSLKEAKTKPENQKSFIHQMIK
jgi:hypothetical protein